MKDYLIFVYSGSNLPEYAFYSLNFAARNSNCKCILLTDAKNLGINRLDSSIGLHYIENFHDKSILIDFKIGLSKKFQSKFRDDFWFKVYERFFIIQSFMRINNIDNFFHAECDNLIFDLSNLSKNLSSISNGVFVPRDSINRSIHSLIYVNNISTFDLMCDKFKEMKTFENEMIQTALIVDNNVNFYSLPTDTIFNTPPPKWNFISPLDIDGIFDAASIGQWLFGVDGRNIIGPIYNHFKNEMIGYNIDDCIFSFSNNKFSLRLNNKIYNVYNLHFHSKLHKKILSDCNFSKYTFNNKRILLDFNIKNSLINIILKIRNKSSSLLKNKF
jgi:hypothetical protein